ncbi:MAG: ferritin-like domain-containing protein [Candidatus Sumerlaeaceae bacterium]
MELESLQDLFVSELKDVYHAEKQLLKALPKMAKKATSEDLADAFSAHLAETEEQVARIEQIFSLMGKKPATKVCKGMKGLVEEGSEMMSEDAEDEVMDAGLISAAQRIEHYEIAAYGCLRTYARVLGDKKIEKLLQQTLDEEAAADEKLTELADAGINLAAA